MKNLFELMRKQIHGAKAVLRAYIHARKRVLRNSGEEPFGPGPKHPLP